VLSGGQWLHEIKHDGFRVLVRRVAAGQMIRTHSLKRERWKK
jgi:ATP-dependent DNA ligase